MMESDTIFFQEILEKRTEDVIMLFVKNIWAVAELRLVAILMKKQSKNGIGETFRGDMMRVENWRF